MINNASKQQKRKPNPRRQQLQDHKRETHPPAAGAEGKATGAKARKAKETAKVRRAAKATAKVKPGTHDPQDLAAKRKARKATAKARKAEPVQGPTALHAA